MNERITEVRKAIGITAKDFAEKIGFAAGFLSQMESGKRAVNERAQKLICSEFNVNLEWLKTGDGEMFLPSKEDPLTVFCKENKIGALPMAFLRAYTELDDDGKLLLENYLNEAVSALQEEKEQRLSISLEEYVSKAKKRAEEEAIREYEQAAKVFKGDLVTDLLVKAG